MSEYTQCLSQKTKYKDVIFRSHLEARWAVFFDVLGIQWEYEPFYSDIDFYGGLADYKIDFFLKETTVYAEVKPFERLNQLPFGAIEKTCGWAKEHGDVLLLLGPPTVSKLDAEKHVLVIWSDKLQRHVFQKQMRWTRCPRCGKVSIAEGGGIPVDCQHTCFSKGPETDLFGNEMDEPPGHLDKKIQEACRRAKQFLRG